MKEGDKFLAELTLKRLAEARDEIERELKTLLIWRMPEYRVNKLPATTEN